MTTSIDRDERDTRLDKAVRFLRAWHGAYEAEALAIEELRAEKRSVERLEALGRRGLVISIAYGQNPTGVGYSVDCLHHLTSEAFEHPYAARSFEHCLDIVEFEARRRGWALNRT